MGLIADPPAEGALPVIVLLPVIEPDGTEGVDIPVIGPAGTEGVDIPVIGPAGIAGVEIPVIGPAGIAGDAPKLGIETEEPIVAPAGIGFAPSSICERRVASAALPRLLDGLSICGCASCEIRVLAVAAC